MADGPILFPCRKPSRAWVSIDLLAGVILETSPRRDKGTHCSHVTFIGGVTTPSVGSRDSCRAQPYSSRLVFMVAVLQVRGESNA